MSAPCAGGGQLGPSATKAAAELEKRQVARFLSNGIVEISTGVGGCSQ